MLVTREAGDRDAITAVQPPTGNHKRPRASLP